MCRIGMGYYNASTTSLAVEACPQGCAGAPRWRAPPFPAVGRRQRCMCAYGVPTVDAHHNRHTHAHKHTRFTHTTPHPNNSPSTRTYKGFIGPAPCTSCPANSSTAAGHRASVAVTDCDSCKPGYGGLTVTAGAPACAICASGTFSAGYKAGGPACDACPQLANYTGRMVSRQGALDVSECYGEFLSDGADRAPLQYDFIPMEAAALTAITAAAANASAAGCQAACAASNECQVRPGRRP
jgi:hypothetical protein